MGDRRGPKYLNSRESRLYNKSETLYGMDQARDEIRRRKAAVLVEGYFDCIGLHQAGVKHAVALCSTALTPGHLGAARARPRRRSWCSCSTATRPGARRSSGSPGALLAGGAATRVALLPEGEDPDTFARRSAPRACETLLGAARAAHRAPVRGRCCRAGGRRRFEEKMGAIDRLEAVAAQLPVGLARSAFFAALAAHSGLPAAELEADAAGQGRAVVARCRSRADASARAVGPTARGAERAAGPAAPRLPWRSSGS